jgi:subtilisin family serine protease
MPAFECRRLLIVQDDRAAGALAAMCRPSRAEFLQTIQEGGIQLAASCHLQGACQRLFHTALHGAAGNFTEIQLEDIRRCLPGSVYYREPDLAVEKAEDGARFRVDAPAAAAAAAGRRRRRLRQRAAPALRTQADFDGNSALQGGALDLRALSTQGVSMSAPVEKRQALASRLWSLDRIDQHGLPLDGLYRYGSRAHNATGLGEGVTIYVLDSGIYSEHQEFASFRPGAPPRASLGPSFVLGAPSSRDEDGHGSHVAGSAAGLQCGIAKGANVVAVRVLDANGVGTVAATVSALDWVAANARPPAVVSMSLGVASGDYSRAMEQAVRALVQTHGIVVVVAAGNAAGEACQFSPAAVPEAITVGASDLAGKWAPPGTQAPPEEGVYEDGNMGACVDLFAPGVEVWSVCGGARRCGAVSPETYAFASGTSMATPLVAGAAAVYLGQHPAASPAEVAAALVGAASVGRLAPRALRPGTPNRLLFTGADEPAAVQAAQGPSP